MGEGESSLRCIFDGRLSHCLRKSPLDIARNLSLYVLASLWAVLVPATKHSVEAHHCGHSVCKEAQTHNAGGWLEFVLVGTLALLVLYQAAEI